MAHKMGLAIIGTSQATGVYHTKYYLDNTYSWLHNKSTQTIKRSYTYTAHNAYPSNSDTQYTIVSISTTNPTVISTNNEYTSSDGTNAWSYTASSVISGNCYNVTPPTPTMSCVNWTKYTVETGDVFFKDGALAKVSSTYSTSLFPNRIPVGLVTSISTTSADASNGYTHGYVLSLKEANGGNVTDWGAVDGIHDRINPTGHALTTPSVAGLNAAQIAAVDAAKIAEIRADREGLTYSRTALARSDKNYYYAFIKANEYNTTMPIIKDARITTSNKISEWFLGAIGQYIDASVEFGTVKSVTPVCRDHADFYFPASTNACVNAINAKFTSKITDSSYYDLFITEGTTAYRSEGNKGLCYLSSTGYDSSQNYVAMHWSFDTWYTDDHYITRDRRDYASVGGVKLMKVRPMLAF